MKYQCFEERFAKFFGALKIIQAVLFRISMSDFSQDTLLYNPCAYNTSLTSTKCGCSEGAEKPQSLLFKGIDSSYFAFRYRELAITRLMNR